jgi:hypothetical protein
MVQRHGGRLMAQCERLGRAPSLAAAAILTAGVFSKVAIKAGFDLVKLPGGRVFEARGWAVRTQGRS